MIVPVCIIINLEARIGLIPEQRFLIDVGEHDVHFASPFAGAKDFSEPTGAIVALRGWSKYLIFTLIVVIAAQLLLCRLEEAVVVELTALEVDAE